mgnify:CR=1 FL=1
MDAGETVGCSGPSSLETKTRSLKTSNGHTICQHYLIMAAWMLGCVMVHVKQFLRVGPFGALCKGERRKE